MFCPMCGFEYKPEISKCPDCGAVLVDKLTVIGGEKQTLSKEYTWVQLARLNSEMMAEMVVEALRQQDIPVVVLSGTGHFGITGQMGSYTYNPIGGGYSLMIAEEFVKDADEICAVIVGDEWDECRLVDFE